MRKLFVLPIVLAGIVFNGDVFAAVARTGRGVSASNASAAATNTSNARAAVARSAVNKTANTNNTGAVSARSALKKTTANTVTTATTNKAVGARAASSQKVIQTGSKVSVATENTVISQECQDMFFGCMDAFCMLDNASGGRCQCSDRGAELDAVLDEILKLDEQTYVMATEGVERLKMGEAEEEIMARAKAAGDRVTGQQDNARKSPRQLDLSAWDSNIFGDMEDDDIFGNNNDKNDLSKLSGDALYKSSLPMCIDRIPAQCKSYSSMLQMIYGQKIKSDCIAYENSLKQQKSASTQKLQTAQKALRDAALEEYQNENKYDLGQCATRFTDCMRGADVCDSDYTGCVILAAKENAKGSKAKQTTIKGTITNINLAATTMEQLLSKKEICAHVTKQCVSANKGDAVWNLFLRDAAPALKSAEEIAEQKLRMNCIPTLADCFQKACKSNMDPNDPDGSFDMCLANPETYKSLCKVQLEPCLTATGGTYANPKKSTLWNSLLNALAAMKVDACTEQIKECLTADTACGENYAGCVGLSTDVIMDLCPTVKLTACQDKDFSADTSLSGDYGDEDPVRAYVNKIADGIALSIDNNLLLTCQNALNQAIINVCGDTEECSQLVIGNLTADMQVQPCKAYNSGELECKQTVTAFVDKDFSDTNNHGILAKLTGKINVAKIDYDSGENESPFTFNGVVSGTEYSVANTNNAVNALNTAFNNTLNRIESDPTVDFCMNGRSVQTTNKSLIDSTKKSDNTMRFENLTGNVRNLIASRLLASLSSQTQELESKYNDKMEEVSASIYNRIKRIEDMGEAEHEKLNQEACEERNVPDAHRSTASNRIANNYIRELTDKEASYDSATGICTVRTIKYSCTKYISPSCRTFDNGTLLNTETIQMSKIVK